MSTILPQQDYLSDATFRSSVSTDVIKAWKEAKIRAFRAMVAYFQKNKDDFQILTDEFENAAVLAEWAMVYGLDESDFQSSTEVVEFVSSIAEVLELLTGVAEERFKKLSRMGSEFKRDGHRISHLFKYMQKYIYAEIALCQQIVDPQAGLAKLDELQQIVDEYKLYVEQSMPEILSNGNNTIEPGNNLIQNLTDISSPMVTFDKRLFHRLLSVYQKENNLSWQSVIVPEAMFWYSGLQRRCLRYMSNWLRKLFFTPIKLSNKPVRSNVESLISTEQEKHLKIESQYQMLVLLKKGKSRTTSQITTNPSPESGLLEGDYHNDPAICPLLTRLEVVPYDYESRWELARRYVTCKAFAEAIREYTKLLQDRPELHEARLEFVDCCIIMKQWDKAFRELTYLGTIQRLAEESQKRLAIINVSQLNPLLRLDWQVMPADSNLENKS